jgi:hypothetical protein
MPRSGVLYYEGPAQVDLVVRREGPHAVDCRSEARRLGPVFWNAQREAAVLHPVFQNYTRSRNLLFCV